MREPQRPRVYQSVIAALVASAVLWFGIFALAGAIL